GGTSVDDGVVAGQFEARADSLGQLDKNYGVNSQGWHGASLVKSLSKQVQDFTVTALVGFSATNKNQIGRVEIYFLDVNGNKIGKMGINDSSATGEFPRIIGRAGNFETGTYFANNYGTKQDTYKQFYGEIAVTRKGNKWELYVAKVDNTTRKPHTVMTKKWTDRNNSYMGKVAAIQIHVAAWKSSPFTNTMYISHLMVHEHIVPQSNEIGYVFKTGDI